MKIDVLGSGNAYSQKCNTSAVRVIGDCQQLLIDCGPTIPRAIWQRSLDVADIDAIYFTHIHPDHCLGLTALLNYWHSNGRRNRLQIFVQQEQRAWLLKLAELAFWPQGKCGFDIDWKDITDCFYIGNWCIKTAFSQHEISNRSVRIEADDGVFFYSGDGRPTDQNCALMQDANWVFQECGSVEPLPADSSHGDLDDCLRLREKVSFESLLLYHCPDEGRGYIDRVIQSQPDVFLATDGLQVDLKLRSPGERSAYKRYLQWD